MVLVFRCRCETAKPATKIESESVTNESGYFNFVNLNPATYTLRVEVQGFKGVQTLLLKSVLAKPSRKTFR
jgi:hypothetical protein